MSTVAIAAAIWLLVSFVFCTVWGRMSQTRGER